MEIREISEQDVSTFLAMIDDYRKHDAVNLKSLYPRKLGWSEKEFSKFQKELEKSKQDWRPKAGKTSVTRYIMQGKNGEVLANGVLQFPLDKTTEIDGGNLYCDVPPSQRRQGYGSYCLALLLFEAVRAGLRRVLVTAPANDLVARKVIEKNRGVLQDVVPSSRLDREGVPIARYWIQF